MFKIPKPYAVPGVGRVDEARMIRDSLLSRLNDENMSIGKSAHAFHTKLIIDNIGDEKSREEIICTLRQILEEFGTKPIYVKFFGQIETIDPQTGQKKEERALLEEWVIE